MKTKKNNITTLEQFKENHYGKRGTKKRYSLESGYENFKIGVLIQEVRPSSCSHDPIICQAWDT